MLFSLFISSSFFLMATAVSSGFFFSLLELWSIAMVVSLLSLGLGFDFIISRFSGINWTTNITTTQMPKYYPMLLLFTYFNPVRKAGYHADGCIQSLSGGPKN